MSDQVISTIVRAEIPELQTPPEYIGQFFMEDGNVLHLPFKDADEFILAVNVLQNATTGIAVVYSMEDTPSAIHRARFIFATAVTYQEWRTHIRKTKDDELL